MITIIIVVYKSDPKKLNKILKLIGSNFKIVIIDNSYTYDFKDISISKKTIVIRSQNIGNGAGINLGIKHTKTPYALYFDIDVNFNKDLIRKLVAAAKKIKKFGILAPNNGKFKTKCKIIEHYNFEAPVMLFNIKKLKKIGLFDEKIFLYFEEIDLFFKCKKNNIKVLIITDIIIKHVRSSSIFQNLDNNKILFLRKWHYMWSMFYYYKKNFNYFFGVKKTILYFIKDLIKLGVNIVLLNKKEIFIRINRIDGLLTSYLLLKSYKRIS